MLLELLLVNLGLQHQSHSIFTFVCISERITQSTRHTHSFAETDKLVPPDNVLPVFSNVLLLRLLKKAFRAELATQLTGSE